MAQMPSQLGQDRDAHEQEQMPVALGASSRQDGGPLAFSVLQLHQFCNLAAAVLVETNQSVLHLGTESSW